jgi:hypothetical protein
MRDLLRDFYEEDGEMDDLVEANGDGEFEFLAIPRTEVTVGTVAGSGVTVEEKGNGLWHNTTLTLVDVAVSVTAITTGVGTGGLKVYDFPTGAILRLGCTADLVATVAAADQADYTDNSPEGDIGIGTVIMADVDALGTDATDDDWGTGQALALVAWADGTIHIDSEAPGSHPDSGTALDLNINVLIDAADIDDGATTNLTLNGTITFDWAGLGEFHA